MLRALVEKVQAHLQKKMRIRSLHTSSYRPLEIDGESERSANEQFNDEELLYSGGYDQEYVKVETNDSTADRENEQHSTLSRDPLSLADLEVPVEQEQQRKSDARWRDEIRHHERQERVARANMHYDDDIAYHDRWGRPVYRQELDEDGDDFDPDAGGEGAEDVIDLSSRQRLSRLLKRRHWRYLEDSEWVRRSQGYAHVSPRDEDRVASPSEAIRQSKQVIRRRYSAYDYAGNFSDEEVESHPAPASPHESSRSAMQYPRVPSFLVEDQCSDYETEGFLGREEEILAEQAYPIKTHSKSHYGSRRDLNRLPRNVREISSPPYHQNRTSPSGSGTLYPYEYLQDQAGAWFTEEEGLDLVYRRYPHHPAGLYAHPYMGFHAMSIPRRRRSSSYSLPNGYPRHTGFDSPRAGTSKRRKMSNVSQTDGFLRKERADIQTSNALHSHSDSDRQSNARVNVAGDAQRYGGGDCEIATGRDTAYIAHYDVPSATMSDDSSEHINRVENELVEPGYETCDGVREPTQCGKDKDPLHPAEFCGDATKHDMDEHSVEGRVQQPQECEVAVRFEEETGAADPSLIEGAMESTGVGESAASATEHASANRISSRVSACIPANVAFEGTEQAKVGAPSALLQSPQRLSVLQRSASECSLRDASSEHFEETEHCERSDEVVCTKQPPHPTSGMSFVSLGNAKTSRVLTNLTLMTSLQHDSAVATKWIAIQNDVTLHQKKCLDLGRNCRLLGQLGELCNTVYDLQCQVVSAGCTLRGALKRQMLEALDAALQVLSEPEMSTSAKIGALTGGIKQALSLGEQDLEIRVLRDDYADCAPAENVKQSPGQSPGVGAYVDSPFDDRSWDNSDGWFESTDDHYDVADFEEAEKLTKETNPESEVSSARNEHLVMKREEDAFFSSKSPSYVSTLFSDMSSCSPTSFVMKGMQKRLFAEIGRANPYYYLHPVKLLTAASMKSRPSCDFGCLSGSAGKWTQKVISQISSRMKWFDEVTYSLAKACSGGAESGTEILNRKKMNSTIRKLHLVAIQLHCLVSHLYCVRGRAECKECDSLPAALNNSYFEKRMTGYKSRLKLDIDPHGSSEGLLRDTFEFFPEFLLCIEMWGYDYREGVGASGHASKLRTSSKALPLAFFGHVESAVFDYAQDKNGFLQTICEELLSVVCLWNDFVWGDDLEALSLERIVTFEADVKKSVSKILQTYSLHLMGSWANRLMEKPEELLGLRFTQQNAYYAESSKMRALATPNQRIANPSIELEQTDHCEDEEEELVNDYWTQKTEASESEVKEREGLSDYLSVDTIRNWDRGMTDAHVLKWSRMFQIRGELETYHAVLNDLVKGSLVRSPTDSNHNEVVQELRQVLGKSRVVGRDLIGVSETIALHSASCQLPQERKDHGSSPMPAETVAEPAADVSEDERSCGGNRRRRSRRLEKASGEADGGRPAHPDVKDLVQILASTKKEVEEIFCTRTRSARMRDKLQLQSIQLAQQTVDLFQNIMAMSNE